MGAWGGMQAGDQLLRKDMSEAQREQLTALLDDFYDGFVQHVSKTRDKPVEQVAGPACACVDHAGSRTHAH